MQELKLGPRQFGLLGSSFFLLFAVSSVATGFLVNRVQARWVLLAMGFIWALTQFPMIGSVGFATLVACRIALGAGEGPATPVALHSAYKWFPNELRTLPTAVIVQGGAIGVMVALPLLNSVILHWTWHWAFGSLGLVGLIWCALWLIFGREGSLDSESVKAKDAAPSRLRVGYAQLLLSPTILACWAAAFGANWALSLALSWQGAYLTAVASSAGLFAPYIMGSVIETATTPLDGFNTGFFMCGVIMLVGGAIAMALVNPEREAKRQSTRLQPLTAST
jgi:MFS family permease